MLQPSCDPTAPLRSATAARWAARGSRLCSARPTPCCGALGLGRREPGEVAYLAGTSTVILGHHRELDPRPRHRFLVTPLADDRPLGLEMDLLATGSATTWLAAARVPGTGRPAELAASVDPGDAPVLLPYLSPASRARCGTRCCTAPWSA